MNLELGVWSVTTVCLKSSPKQAVLFKPWWHRDKRCSKLFFFVVHGVSTKELQSYIDMGVFLVGAVPHPCILRCCCLNILHLFIYAFIYNLSSCCSPKAMGERERACGVLGGIHRTGVGVLITSAVRRNPEEMCCVQ